MITAGTEGTGPAQHPNARPDGSPKERPKQDPEDSRPEDSRPEDSRSAEVSDEIRTVERLRGLRKQVTTEMGSPSAVSAIHAAGRRTAREHITQFVDPGSFGEIGTFATFVDKVTAPEPGPPAPASGQGGRTDGPQLSPGPTHRPVPSRAVHCLRLFHRMLSDRGGGVLVARRTLRGRRA